MQKRDRIKLSAEERKTLEALALSGTGKKVIKARALLLADEGGPA